MCYNTIEKLGHCKMGKSTIDPFACEADYHRWINANCGNCDRSFNAENKWKCSVEKRISDWDITKNKITVKQAQLMGMTEVKPEEYAQLFTCKCRGFKQ